jgi:hypothetical protein
MNKKTKCLLCNKELEDNESNTTYEQEQHLRTEHLFDVFSVGVNQLAKTAFYNPDLAELGNQE